MSVKHFYKDSRFQAFFLIALVTFVAVNLDYLLNYPLLLFHVSAGVALISLILPFAKAKYESSNIRRFLELIQITTNVFNTLLLPGITLLNATDEEARKQYVHALFSPENVTSQNKTKFYEKIPYPDSIQLELNKIEEALCASNAQDNNEMNKCITYFKQKSYRQTDYKNYQINVNKLSNH
ncbi:hypothetical protein [Bombella apis]|uniref:hypothetical protein n=1 Tax=Bombella apis TaxID=1785988 RepID=UPI0024A7EFF2|nr:hypothetical protein [Bombella apis]